MQTKKILRAIVVDDDLAQAKGVVNQLRRWGFTCKEFNRWAGAKAELETSPGVDLLVVDNALKEVESGIQLVAGFLESSKRAPGKILVLSGYASSLNKADRDAAAKWDLRVEAKPFDPRVIADLFPTATRNHAAGQGKQAGAIRRGLGWFATPEGVGVTTIVMICIGLLAWLYPNSNSPSGEGFAPKGDNARVPIKVRLAVNPVPLAALPIIAQIGRFWQDHGLDVELISFPTGKASLDAVLGGGADFATSAETPIMRAALAGFTPAVLATIASSPDDCKVCYRRDHGIAQAADLRGQKVATAFGTSAEYFMDVFLRHHGISRSEVTALNMKPAEMVTALLRGDISAFFIWEPYPLEATKRLKDSGGIFLGDGIYTETFQIVTRQDYARKNNEACQRLLRALLAAEHHASTDEQDAAEKVATFTQLAPADVSAIWKNFRFRVELKQDLVALLESQAIWAQANDPSMAKSVSFQRLMWPEPLQQVESGRVVLSP